MTLLTEDQVATQLGVSTDTLWRWRRAKRIPFRKLGRKIRYTPDDVEQIVNGSLIPAKAEARAAKGVAKG